MGDVDGEIEEKIAKSCLRARVHVSSTYDSQLIQRKLAWGRLLRSLGNSGGYRKWARATRQSQVASFPGEILLLLRKWHRHQQGRCDVDCGQVYMRWTYMRDCPS